MVVELQMLKSATYNVPHLNMLKTNRAETITAVVVFNVDLLMVHISQIHPHFQSLSKASLACSLKQSKQ